MKSRQCGRSEGFHPYGIFHRYFPIPWFLLISAVFSLAPAFALESGPKQVTLLEVYSSEGCSSCPPADQWIAQLEKQAGLWTKFVPVVFHVDYWDTLGWKDSLATPLFSERQHNYAEAWKTGTVYTPGFVLNGKEWRSWRSEHSVPDLNRKSPGQLSIQRFNEKYYTVSFTAANKALPPQSVRAHVALLGQNIRHEILRGENAGETLIHHFVVIGFGEEQMHPEGGHFSALISPQKTYPKKIRESYIAAWVADATNLEVLQAVGGPI